MNLTLLILGKRMPLVLGGSGGSGRKEFCKLLATMTMARLDPQAQKYSCGDHFGTFLNGREKSFLALEFIRKNNIIIIGAWKYQQFFSCL